MHLSFIRNKIPVPDILTKYISQHTYNENPNEITWITNSYVNKSIGGSECMSHTINKFLLNQGFKINVIGEWDTELYDGIQLINIKDSILVHNAIGSCKFIFSQNYNFPEIAVRIGDRLNKKVFVFIHTTSNVCDPSPERYIHMMKDKNNIHIIYNSNWISNLYSHLNLKSHILIPPIRSITNTQSNTYKYITLINTSYDKGGQHFIDIAKRLPQYQFLGVGNYGIKDTTVSNISYIENTHDIRAIYSETDIILMPSIYESWGMVASESIMNGIPVIAADTPGLHENLGCSGIFIKRDSIDEWVSMIVKLKTDRNFYTNTSTKCKIRGSELLNLHIIQLNSIKSFVLY